MSTVKKVEEYTIAELEALIKAKKEKRLFDQYENLLLSKAADSLFKPLQNCHRNNAITSAYRSSSGHLIFKTNATVGELKDIGLEVTEFTANGCELTDLTRIIF
jgi:hypothetical protein